MKRNLFPLFKKSSFSGERSEKARCVEVAVERDRVLVRNSRDRTIVVQFSLDEWQAFVLGVKNSEFEVGGGEL